MGRLLFVLTLALIVCALSLVGSQYKGRSLFVEVDRVQATARDLDVEWRRLQLEQTDNAKHALIDSVARNTLKMEPVTPARTIYLAQPHDSPNGPALLPYGPPGVPVPPKAPPRRAE